MVKWNNGSRFTQRVMWGWLLALGATLAGPLTVIGGSPSKVAFISAPQSFIAGSNSALITIQIQDAGGNPTNATARTVTLTSTSANGLFRNNTDTATITSITIAANATSTNFLYRDAKADGPVLTAAVSGLTSATQIETILPGAFAKLQLLVPGETAAPGSTTGKTGTPTAQTAGTALNVTINAVDAYWNILNSVGDTVALTSSDANAQLPANTPLSAGTAVFSVTPATAGTTTLTATDATDAAKTANTSPNITVNAAAFAKLQLLMPGETAAPGSPTGKTGTPNVQTAGTAFTVIVNGVDANWNLTTSANGSSYTIHLTSSDTNATLPLDANLASGTHSFSVTLKTAANQTITASDVDDATKTASTSPATIVNPGAASKLVMAVQPSAIATAGAVFAQQPVIFIEDQFNNFRSNDTLVVTAMRNAGSGTLLGSTNVAAVGGVVAFTNLAHPVATSITIQFASGALTAATSGPIALNPAPFSQLLVMLPGETNAPGTAAGTTGTPASMAGASIAVRLLATDSFFNPVAGITDSVHVTASDPNALPPADVALVNGTNAVNLTFKTAGAQSVSASDISDGTKSPNTDTVTVNAGALAKLQVLAPGESATPGTASGKAGSPLAQTAGTGYTVTVNAVDANWNLVSTNDTVHLASTDANAGLPANAALAAGTKNFSLTDKSAGSWTVTASDVTHTGIGAGTGSAVAVTAGSFAKLQLLMPGETAAPGTASGKSGTPAAQTAGTPCAVTVNAVDANWNLITTVSDTVALTSSDPNALLPPSSPLSGGTGTFAVTFKTAGSRTVTATDATDGSKTANTGAATAVNAGPFTQLQVLLPGEAAAPGTVSGQTGTPVAQTSGTAFTVTVNAVDSSFNLVSTNDTVHLTSSDASAALPTDAALAAGTKGLSVTLKTAGNATLTASDVTSPTISPDTSSTVAVKASAFAKLQLLVPGETAAPGTPTGKTGTPIAEAATAAFIVTVNAVDANWNLVSTNDTVRLTSTDPMAVLPANTPLANGARTFSIILRTVGTTTLTASNVTHTAILASTSPAITVNLSPLRGGPVVAIHDSEYTRALESMTATNPTTPTGPGTTGFEWWPTNWHYFVMPEALKEALRSDGTSFEVLGDADISAGRLLDTNGQPRYPILISLASEAVADSELGQLTNYVAGGGTLLAGSSAFTRFTNGAPRGDFALAEAMGIHAASAGLQNWSLNATFSKLTNHALTAHIPFGLLTWQMPSAADEISWGVSPAHTLPSGHPLWNVQASNATVIAQGDAGRPYLTVKSYGKGSFIYCAAMQPLVGHGGYAPGMYAYGIFRNAIQGAFAAAHLPLPRLSPWPYPYDAALNVRHDFEDYQNMISSIESSAQFESTNGAKGDYYFCTGTLRVEMTNSPAVIASLQRAVTNYGASIGPHNGGLPNPDNSSLLVSSYDYWHWGPDEVLDITPSGYASGKGYALASISNSFNDVQGWLSGTTNGLRAWVAPYFNATRENSYDLEQQLGVTTAGEQKLSPFPHWTLSTQTSGKRYPFVTLPVSDWYVGSVVAQSMEAGHDYNTVHDLVDAYYGMGALVNLYCHSSSDGGGAAGGLTQEYIRYSTSKPRIWSANAASVYAWWVRRAAVQVVPTFALLGNQAIATLTIAGATDPQTTVEVLLPQSAPGLQVYTNGVLASAPAYRVSAHSVKVQVGTSVSTAQVIYTPTPTAQDDSYTLVTGTTLSVPPSGVLTNDSVGVGTNLIASLVSGPTHGALTLNADGSFTYTPTTNFYGVDSFTYQDYDGLATGNVATVTLLVNPNVSALYSDDFTRSSDPAPLTPWVAQSGAWSITGGQLVGGTNALHGYGFAYLANSWTNFTVQAQLRFPAGAYGGGLGGRLDPLSGAHYAAWIYPEGSPGGSSVLKLVKFQNWSVFSYGNVVNAAMQQVNLPGVGTNWHTLELAFQDNQIKVYFDAVLMITATDTETQTYTSGGICVDMWTDLVPFTLGVDNVLVTTPRADQTLTFAAPANQIYGVAPFTPSASASSGLPVSLSVVSGPATILSNVLSITGVGTVTVKAAQPGDSSYNPAPSVTQSFTVSPAVLTVTANDQTRAYGATNPVLSFGFSGFVNGDTAGVLSGSPALSTAAQANSPVGSYPIMVLQGSLGAANYNFSLVNGSLTVVPAALTATAANQTRPYGAANPAFTGTVVGVQNNDPITASYSTAADPTSPVGAYAIVPALSGSLSNYSVMLSNGSLSVTPAALSVTADNQGRPYGSPNPALTGTILGIQNGDPISASYNTAATAASPAGSYAIVPSPAGPLANYSVTLHNGTLAVSPVALTVSADNKTRPYGVTNPPLTFTATGFIAGEDASVLSGAPALSTPALTNSPVGTYPIFISTGTLSNANYAFVFTNGTLTVTSPNGDLLFSDDFSRPLNPGTLAPWVAQEGAWAVTNGVLQGSGAANHYSFAYVDGSWSDYMVQGQIQFSTSAGFGGGLGGRLNPVTGAHYGAWVYPEGSQGGSAILKLIKFTAWDTWSGTPMAQVSLPGVGTNWHTLKLAFLTNQLSVFYDGSQVISMTDNSFGGQPAFFSGGLTADMYTDASGAYVFSVDNVVASVNKPTLLITATSTNRIYGATNPVFAGTIVGLRSGDNITASFSTVANPASPVGTYAIVPAAVDPDNLLTNYFLTLSNGTLTVTPAPLTVSADSVSRGYGSTNPVLTGTITGLQNEDNLTATYSTSAGVSSPVGSYSIVPALMDPNSKLGNYSVTLHNGTLNVIPAADGTAFADSFSRSTPGDLSPWVVEEGTWAVTNGALVGAGAVNSYSFAYLNSSWTDYSVEGQLQVSASAGWGGGLGGRLNPFTGAHYAAWVYPEGSQGGSMVLKLIKFEGWRAWSGTPMAAVSLPSVGTNWHSLKLTFQTNQISVYFDGVQLTTVTDNGFDSVPAFLSGAISADMYTDTSPYFLSFDNVAVRLLRPFLTVTANDATRPYGAANPMFTGTISGLQSGDGITASYSSAATPNSPVGSYPIVATLSDPNNRLTNYNVVITNATLTVTPAPLLVSADNQGRTYGAADPAFTATISGFVNGEDASVVSGAPGLSTTATMASPVGEYPITATLGSLAAANYSFGFAPGTLTVSPASLTGTADSKVRFYGEANPVFTATYSGFVNGENAGIVTGLLSGSTLAETNSPVGAYPITVSGQSAPNYTITYLPGTLSVEPAPLLVKANDASRGYGQTNPVFGASITGFVNGEDSTVLAGALAFNTIAETNSPVGTYPIEVSGLSATNYSLTFSNGTLTITPYALLVTADNKSRTYGAANPALTGTLSGVQNGDNITANYSTSADTNSPVGDYSIVPALSDPDSKLANYSVTVSNGTLSVTATALVVTADDKTKAYGEAVPTLTGTVTGVQNGDNITATYSTAADASSPVSTYSIAPALQDPDSKLGNYTVTTNNGTLTVTPAPLLVSAHNQGRTYGAADPAFTATITGFVNGEDASVVSGAPGLSSAATMASPVADYPITAALGSLTAANYSFGFAPGTLTISPAPLLGMADNKSRLYGEPNPIFTASYSGFVNGENAGIVTGLLSGSTTAETNSPVGAYPITVSGQSAPNYTITYLSGTLSVGPAPLLVKANDASRGYGQTNPVFGASITGLVNGEDSSVLAGALAFSTIAETNSPVGTYPIEVSGLSATNYSLTFSNGTLTITPYALTVTAENKSRTYGAANPALTGTLSGVQNGDNITANYSTGADTNSLVGDYSLVPALSDPDSKLANYSVTVSNGTLSVTAAALVVTADDKTKAYGEAVPTLTGTVTGVQNGDNITATYSTAADASSPVSIYSIAPALQDPDSKLGNYTVTTNNGTLTISPAPLTGTADSKVRFYGEANPVFTASYSGFVNGEDVGIVTGLLGGSTTAETNSPVGAYPITVSGQSAPNYTITYLPGTLSVGPAPLLVKANDASRGYGQTNPVFGASITGFVNGEDSSVLAGALAFNTTAETNSPVGTYPIEVSGLSATNYSLTFSNGTLTITPYALTVTADNKSRTYGAANPALTGTLSGVQNGDNITANYSTGADTNSLVGDYSIVPALSDPDSKLTNYSVTVSNGTLSVTAAALVVTADDKTKVYGEAVPTLTGTVTGVQNGDNITATYSTAADASSPVSTYSIAPALQDPDSKLGNYTVTTNNGTLTITAGNTAVALSASANPCPTGSNVTITAAVSALLPSQGTPGGLVQFFVDGAAFGLPMELGDGSANLTTALLSHGYHTVTAQFDGDANFSGATGTLVPDQLINSAPAAGALSLGTSENQPASLTALDLIAGSSDPDGDALTVAAVSPASAEGGTVALSGNTILYTPPANYTGTDSFTYVLRDSFGATATGTVTACIHPAVIPPPTLTGVFPQPGGAMQIRGTGVSNQAYVLQAAPDLKSWSSLETNTADGTGAIFFQDDQAPNYPARYYRLMVP